MLVNKDGDPLDMKDGWHLDKKVPLTIIIALLCQTASLIIWGAKLDGRVAVIETTATNHTIVIEALRNAQNQVTVGLARIEERQIITAEGVKEIKQQLNDQEKDERQQRAR